MKRVLGALEWLFRHFVAYPVLRLLFRNEYSDRPIDLQQIRRVLILRFDRIGDMIVTTPIFRILKQRHPSLQVGVLTSPENAEIVQQNPNVDAIYVLHRNWWKLWREIRKARRGEYDLVLNFIFNRTTSAGILANLIAPQGIKIGQGDAKYRFYFNRLLNLDRSHKHMVEVLVGYVETVFGITIPSDELWFEIVVDRSTKLAVDEFLERCRVKRRTDSSLPDQRYIVLNISATDAVRQLSHRQTLELARHLVRSSGYSVLLIAAPSMRHRMDDIVREVGSERCCAFPDHGSASLLHVASLLEGAVAIVTPDTSVIHFASAMKTPVLGIFTPLQRTHEWVPYKVQHATLFAPAGKPVSALPPEQLFAAVDEFLRSLQSP
jgi:ADP-heptose:LPS heptosyltransferase